MKHQLIIISDSRNILKLSFINNRMLKNLYDKCIKLASHRYAKAFLAFFSFIESSIFPIPPDVEVGKCKYLSLNINLKPLLAPEQLGLASSH